MGRSRPVWFPARHRRIGAGRCVEAVRHRGYLARRISGPRDVAYYLRAEPENEALIAAIERDSEQARGGMAILESRGIQCAEAIGGQHAIDEFLASQPFEEGIQFRIGRHLADPVVRVLQRDVAARGTGQAQVIVVRWEMSGSMVRAVRTTSVSPCRRCRTSSIESARASLPSALSFMLIVLPRNSISSRRQLGIRCAGIVAGDQAPQASVVKQRHRDGRAHAHVAHVLDVNRRNRAENRMTQIERLARQRIEGGNDRYRGRFGIGHDAYQILLIQGSRLGRDVAGREVMVEQRRQLLVPAFGDDLPVPAVVELVEP